MKTLGTVLFSFFLSMQVGVLAQEETSFASKRKKEVILDFGSVQPGQSVQKNIPYENTTDTLINIPLIDISGSGYEISSSPSVTVPPHSIEQIVLVFTASPTAKTGDYMGRVTVYVRQGDGDVKAITYRLKTHVN